MILALPTYYTLLTMSHHHVGDRHEHKKEYTHTELKTPVMSMSPVITSGVSGLAEELVGGGSISTARVCASAVPVINETPELRQKSVEDNQRYQREQVKKRDQEISRTYNLARIRSNKILACSQFLGNDCSPARKGSRKEDGRQVKLLHVSTA